MPRPARLARRPAPATIATAVAAAVMLAGALIWFVPYVTRKQTFPAGVPDPAALFQLTEFPVKPHGEACLSDVTIDANSRLAEVLLRPVDPARHLGPPVELVLRGQGYRGVMQIPGGYPGGSATLPIQPLPKRTVIGTACFVNRGSTTVLLDGTDETRTLSRSTTVVEGRPMPGDIALTFVDNRPRRLITSLGEVFGHASNLTDRLVPVWLIWVIAILLACGVPSAVLVAFHRALREDEAGESAA